MIFLGAPGVRGVRSPKNESCFDETGRKLTSGVLALVLHFSRLLSLASDRGSYTFDIEGSHDRAKLIMWPGTLGRRVLNIFGLGCPWRGNLG